MSKKSGPILFRYLLYNGSRQDTFKSKIWIRTSRKTGSVSDQLKKIGSGSDSIKLLSIYSHQKSNSDPNLKNNHIRIRTFGKPHLDSNLQKNHIPIRIIGKTTSGSEPSGKPHPDPNLQ